jgi:MOSC domain-containing protein YiiM
VIHVGDVFRVGSALIEVTQPRVPCYKLGLKMGLSGFEKRFLASCRVGFYMRVLEEGGVGAGDVFERVRTDPERMTVREICRLLYFDSENLEGTRRALRIRALSPGWRQSFEERLANWNSRRSLLPRR